MAAESILLYAATTIIFTCIASQKLKTIFTKISSVAKTRLGSKIFILLSSIKTHSFKWLLFGKTLQETGEYYNNKPMTNVGSAISIPSAFVISIKFGSIPVLSKATQGFLISIKPWNNAHSLFMNCTMLPEQFVNSTKKGILWGARDGIEKTLGIFSKHKIFNKATALFLIEPNFSKTLKVLLRENYESDMLKTWKDICTLKNSVLPVGLRKDTADPQQETTVTLEDQTPYIISNLLYAFSIDPLFNYFQITEAAFKNTTMIYFISITSGETPPEDTTT